MFSELERSKSSQLIVRQETNLRMSDMPFNDQNNGDGYYTVEMNDNGQPTGHGTLRLMMARCLKCGAKMDIQKK